MKQHQIILYAEDDENDAFLVERAFNQAEISNPLLIVPDGNEAIQYLAGTGKYADRKNHPLPCLVLLDLKMVGKSGLEVLKWIRNQPSVCTLPVIMLTSSHLDADVHRSYLLGANGFLVKPNTPDAMLIMAKAIKDYWLRLNRNTGSVESASGNAIQN
jgi:CheY-like chemotaxis protein